MGLVVTPTIGKNDEIKDKQSSYQPDKKTRERLAQISSDFNIAERIRNEPYEEFNFRDVVQYMDDCERAWNTFRPTEVNDPDTSWQSNAVRPLTRNKCISIAAHITSTMLYPGVFAQNESGVSKLQIPQCYYSKSCGKYC